MDGKMKRFTLDLSQLASKFMYCLMLFFQTFLFFVQGLMQKTGNGLVYAGWSPFPNAFSHGLSQLVGTYFFQIL